MSVGACGPTPPMNPDKPVEPGEPVKPSKPNVRDDVPQTGDVSTLSLWGTVCAVSAAGWIILERKKRKSN